MTRCGPAGPCACPGWQPPGLDDDFAVELFDLVRKMPPPLDELERLASCAGRGAQHKRLLIACLRQALADGVESPCREPDAQANDGSRRLPATLRHARCIRTLYRPGMTTMQPTLLIAEPSQPLQNALAHYFSTHGFNVRTADTGADLIGKLQCERPQVVLLEPEILCGCDSVSAPPVPTVVLTRGFDSGPPLPDSFQVDRRFQKPARLAQVAESLQAAAGWGCGAVRESAGRGVEC